VYLEFIFGEGILIFFFCFDLFLLSFLIMTVLDFKKIRAPWIRPCHYSTLEHLNTSLPICSVPGAFQKFFEGGVLKFFLYGWENLGGFGVFLKKPYQIEKISQKGGRGFDPQNPSLNTPLLSTHFHQFRMTFFHSIHKLLMHV